MDEIRVIGKPITLEELRNIAKERFGDMIKIVVNIEKKIIAVGGELHADEEATLLDQGSKQQDLWGANIYVDRPRQSWIEFDSMINIRPSQNNRSRNVEDEAVKQKIISVIDRLII